MPERVRIMVPTEGVEDGDLLVLYGPGADGAIDWDTAVSGREPARRGPVGGGENGPAGLGTAGAECHWMELMSPPVVFGTKQFGVKRLDRDTGAVSGVTPGVASIFVNAPPGPAADFAAVEAAEPGGELKFTFTPGQLV